MHNNVYFIYYVGDYTQEMNERIGARIYAYFIDNKFIREKYIEEIKKLSKIKYKILKPNIFSYKLKVSGRTSSFFNIFIRL